MKHVRRRNIERTVVPTAQKRRNGSVLFCQKRVLGRKGEIVQKGVYAIRRAENEHLLAFGGVQFVRSFEHACTAFHWDKFLSDHS